MTKNFTKLPQGLPIPIDDKSGDRLLGKICLIGLIEFLTRNEICKLENLFDFY